MSPFPSQEVSLAISVTNDALAFFRRHSESLMKVQAYIDMACQRLNDCVWDLEDEVKCSKRILGMASLPDEILAHIFEINDDNPDDFRVRRPNARLQRSVRLSSVCRRFRRIAIAIPSLWNVLELSPTISAMFIKLLLDRSCSSGFHVKANAAWRLDSPALKDLKLNNEITTLTYTGLPSQFSGLLEHASQEAMTNALYEPLRFPRLQRLELGTGSLLRDRDPKLPPVLELGAIAPLITDIVLYGCHVPPRLPDSVKHICLGVKGRPEWVQPLLEGVSGFEGKAMMTLDFQLCRPYDGYQFRRVVNLNDPEPGIVTWRMVSLNLIIDDFLRDFSQVEFPILEDLFVHSRLQSRSKATKNEVHPGYSRLWSIFFQSLFTTRRVGGIRGREAKCFPNLRTVSLRCERREKEDNSWLKEPHQILLTGSFFTLCPVLENLELALVDPDSLQSDIIELELPPQGLKTLHLKDSTLGEATVESLRAVMGMGGDNSGGESRSIEKLVVTNCELPSSGIGFLKEVEQT